METTSKSFTTDSVNSRLESQKILNLRFIFPGNANVKINNNIIEIRINEKKEVTKKDIKEIISSYIEKSNADSVLVSGGIDSSLLAVISKKKLKSIKIITAGVDKSEDVYFSNKLAENIGEELYFAEINEENAVQAIKTLKKMKLDTYNIIMGITEFIALKKAKEIGCKKIMSGLGSDELFLGFYRHKTMEKEKLKEYQEKRLFYMPAFDLLRINSIASYFGISVVLPYLNDELVENIKKMEKIEYNDKSVLRSIGKEFGLSNELTERRKKAMQYGSGVVKLLRDLSRKKHEKVGELIKGI